MSLTIGITRQGNRKHIFHSVWVESEGGFTKLYHGVHARKGAGLKPSQNLVWKQYSHPSHSHYRDLFIERH